MISHAVMVGRRDRPIRTEPEHAQLTASLIALDERDVLSPEEDALAEVLTLLIEEGAATEVLSGRRFISKAQAKRLAEFFHVPIDLFI